MAPIGKPFTDHSMGFLTWIVVGLVAGVLASLVMGGTGYGLIGDIIIGIAGAFIGGRVFRELGTTSPFGGLPRVIFVAVVGAVVVLFALRRLRRATYPGPSPPASAAENVQRPQ